ncbi:peptidoglycan hydrolase-like protein with peptidoglycan-binding domain [Rhodobium orientis]|uniref:Peptidoglycan binding-like domain-containing protein n=1 Tax=Rhodobium orientis TaxID=34017 RepID=A0A327JJE8_9HYPH|nr:peptidoglycan-binding domain-containing protein [Rhodobium orientis]MBB4303902.1 peptidoglycan hydrolase-like protein with peptidoglycan-binding domain [Rhodobium orientis]MBK5951447.1 hypothetical protein [Rhodobium orientis]RAI26151.1 hypothetical protein CH339_15390 [Rhodobium orientis]
MTVSATSAETRGFYRLPAAFFALALAALLPSLLATPAAAQRGDVQRCARTCLDDFGSINHPGYRRCVSRRCLGSGPGPAIRRAPDPVVPPAPVVREGPDRPQVRSVQRQLTELGYDPGPVDGLYGEQTAETIRQFLADRGIRGTGGITRRLHRELAAARAEQRRGIARQKPRTEPRTAPRSERARAPISDDLAPTAPAAKPKPPKPDVAAAPEPDDSVDDAADEEMADMPEDASDDEAVADDTPSDQASAEADESDAPEATAPRQTKPRDILAEAAEARRKAEEAENAEAGNAGAENAEGADEGAEQRDAIAETVEASEEAAADEPEAATADAAGDGPRALIADIYTLPDPDVGVWAKNRRLWYFSDRILELVEAAEAAMKEKSGTEELDFNPIVPGQDYNITDLSISDPEIDGETATVTVRFTNTLGGESKTHELVYTLVTLDDSWLIDDIVTDGTALSDTLREIAGN